MVHWPIPSLEKAHFFSQKYLSKVCNLQEFLFEKYFYWTLSTVLDCEKSDVAY